MLSPISQQKPTQPTFQQQILLQQSSLLLNKTLSQLKRHNHDQQAHTQRLSYNNNLTTFKEIEEYRKISENLGLMEKLKKANSEKLRKLEKNVSNLDFLHRLSFKQTLKLQHKKSKLQQTQSMAQFLNHLKQLNQHHIQQKQQQRRLLCTSLRESHNHNRSFSHSVHQIVKQQRIKQFKQVNSKLMQSHQRNLQQLLEANRRKAHETRMSQMRLKEKLKKYQEYKIYVGRMNYEKKLENEFRNHVQNKRYLREVELKMKEEDKLFRKTEKLKKESKKIEDFYLTGAGLE